MCFDFVTAQILEGLQVLQDLLVVRLAVFQPLQLACDFERQLRVIELSFHPIHDLLGPRVVLLGGHEGLLRDISCFLLLGLENIQLVLNDFLLLVQKRDLLVQNSKHLVIVVSLTVAVVVFQRQLADLLNCLITLPGIIIVALV